MAELTKHLHFLGWREDPRPRQEWVQVANPCNPTEQKWVSSLSVTKEHRAATSSDLVLDLVYVVLLAKLGGDFRTNLDSSMFVAVRDFLALFIPIYNLWSVHNIFLNRFETSDVLFTFFFIASIMLVAFVGISATSCGDASEREACNQFAWCFAGARSLLVLANMYAWYHNTKYRLNIIVYIIPDALVVICWIITGFMPYELHDNYTTAQYWSFILMWWLGIAIDLVRMLLPAILVKMKYFRERMYAQKNILPFNLNLMVERHELFIVICVGEIVAASLAGSASQKETDDGHRLLTDDGTAPVYHPNPYALNALIVLLAAIVKITYFDITEHPQPTGVSCSTRHHAMTVGMYRGLAWVVLHLPLAASIVLLGSVLEPLTLHGALTRNAQFVCCNCLAVIVLITTVFDLLHSGSGVQLRRVRKQWRFAVHLVVAFFLFLIPFVYDWQDARLGFLFLINGLLGSSAMFTIWAHQPLKSLMTGSEEGNKELVDAMAAEEAEMGAIRDSDIVIEDVENIT
jgi:low temperature requirement protein LtrA